jgi:hypothetical protein
LVIKSNNYIVYIYPGERAHDIEILAGLTHEDLNPIYYHAGILGNVQEIQLPAGTEAKVVMIHIKDLRPEYLHLCEVQIYGTFMRKGNLINVVLVLFAFMLHFYVQIR